MKTILLLSAILIFRALGVEPFEPRSIPNSQGQTLPVYLHPEVTSMLVFPEPISRIVGAGLTDGSSPGLVQFDHRKDSPVVTFRPLQAESEVYAQIIAGEIVYFCRLKPGPRPDSVVTVAVPAANRPAEVPVDAVFFQRLELPQERLRQFAELARSVSILKDSIPDEYEGFQSVEVAMVNRVGEVEMRIDKVHRFGKSDVLVFFGAITNRGSAAVEVRSDRLRIVTGESRRLIPNWVTPLRKSIGVGESVPIECVLAGDGLGTRMHLSIRNRFAMTISKTPNFTTP
jgi:hypothetical protein